MDNLLGRSGRNGNGVLSRAMSTGVVLGLISRQSLYLVPLTSQIIRAPSPERGWCDRSSSSPAETSSHQRRNLTMDGCTWRLHSCPVAWGRVSMSPRSDDPSACLTSCPSLPRPSSPPTASCPCTSTRSCRCPTPPRSGRSRRPRCSRRSAGASRASPPGATRGGHGQ